MPRATISLTSKLAIVDFLRTVCHKTGELCQYDPGHSDKTVSEHLSVLRQEHITYFHVRNIREEILGKLKREPKVSPDLETDIIRHLIAVEDKLDQLILLLKNKED